MQGTSLSPTFVPAILNNTQTQNRMQAFFRDLVKAQFSHRAHFSPLNSDGLAANGPSKPADLSQFDDMRN
jgi:hypothetical protein